MGQFKVLKTDSATGARRGQLATNHGVVDTPVFMPIGTVGAVKGTLPAVLSEAGARMLLANTYHLMLRPGVETVEKLGGLHRLMGWDGPILTDSGGYQVFSLNSLTRIDDEGVEFASHVDGRKMLLNARIATEMQNRFGADVIMCFDQCTPFSCEREVVEKAVQRTVRWARACKEAHDGAGGQMLFGIVQGGIENDLRTRCAEELMEIGFDGYAIGGLSVGEGHEHMVNTVEHSAALLPAERARYLMGVGNPSDIIAAVAAGVDMFDCVLPTRNGRNAFAFTEAGPLRLRNKRHSEDTGPVEADCDCYACRNFSRGAIRHFFNVREMLGPILLSLHNIRFYQRLMARIREAIDEGDFSQWAQANLERYRRSGI